jgi:hypothetical protein
MWYLERCSDGRLLNKPNTLWGKALTWLKQTATNILPWPFASAQAATNCQKVVTTAGQAAYRLRI